VFDWPTWPVEHGTVVISLEAGAPNQGQSTGLSKVTLHVP
jgi:hypothetical protein